MRNIKNDINEHNNLDIDQHDLDSLVWNSNSTLRTAQPEQAHVLQYRAKSVTVKPWIDDEVIALRNIRRKLERRWQSAKLPLSLIRYKTQTNYINVITYQKHCLFFLTNQFYKEKVFKKAFYSLIKRLANKPFAVYYPEALNDDELAMCFLSFKNQKLINSTILFKHVHLDWPQNFPSRQCNSRFNEFLFWWNSEIFIGVPCYLANWSLIQRMFSNIVWTRFYL